MRFRGTVLAMSLGLAVAGVEAAPCATGAAVVSRSASSFSISGTVAKVTKAQNTLTVSVKKKRYTIVVSSTTAITVHGSHASLSKVKVGATVHVTGEHLGPLYLGLTIRAS
jgi:hypothetical protein